MFRWNGRLGECQNEANYTYGRPYARALQCLRLDKENGTCLPLMLASVAEHVAGHLSATTGSRTQPLGLLGLPRRCLFETKRQQ